RWRELNADGLIVGTVQKAGTTVKVEMRLFNVRSRQSAFARQYDGTAANPRLFAHTISDEIHKTQRALNGVARSKLTFDSDRDGSNVRRITNHPGIDITPTWSPSGTQIAFTSDRGGTPQIYVVGADGLNLSKKTSEGYCDRPSWSAAPFNEIAFASRSGPGFDIKVLDLTTGTTHVLTFGEGTNESPAFSPNGRHLVFTSTRSGKVQVFTMARDGKNVRQITRSGNNEKPDWSR